MVSDRILSEKRFRRLLSEVENLIEQERFALQKTNLNYLSSLLEQKDSLLEALFASARELNYPVEASDEVRARLIKLVDRQKGNLMDLGDAVTSVKEKLRSVNAGKSRISQFKSAYRPPRRDFGRTRTAYS